MCGYQCGYNIDGENVEYDAGCACVMNPPETRSWDELTRTYNMNQPENNQDIKQIFLDELNKTWQFVLPVIELNKK